MLRATNLCVIGVGLSSPRCRDDGVMGLHTVLVLLLAAVGVIVTVHWIAERTGLPSAALLALGGIGYAFLPGPNVALHPEPVLYCILPPLLYYAALESSLVAIRRNMRA